jgi:hypothetical protein
MSDHDQRFKTLLQEFFAAFLALFFAKWATRLDASGVEWLNQEVFPDPPEGERRALDLVAKLRFREAMPGQPADKPEPWLALVHIEIEARDRAAPLRPRMFRSYTHLRAKYDLPVLPIALYLRVGLDGISQDVYEERLWEFCPIHFEYLYVGLPALDAIEYVQGDNWLGVALSALMKISRDKIAWLGAEALRRIQEAPALTDQQRFLLGECVQAYLPLDDESRQAFETLVASEPKYEGVRAMNATWFEKGMEKGIDKGRRELLHGQLLERFGPLSPAVEERLRQLPVDRLPALAKAVLLAQSLADTGLAD